MIRRLSRFPQWVPTVLGMLGVLTGFAQPLAASVQDGELRLSWRSVRVRSLAFSPDARRLVAGYHAAAINRPGTDWQTWVVQWDLETGEGTVVPQATAPLAVSDDGELLAMALWERSREPGRRMAPVLRPAVWRFGEQEPAQVLTRGDGFDNGVLACCFAYGGRKLVSLNPSGEVLVWTLHSTEPPVVLGRMDFEERRVLQPSVTFRATGMGEILALVPGRVSRGGWGANATWWVGTDDNGGGFQEQWSGSDAEVPPELLRWQDHFATGSTVTLPSTLVPLLSAPADWPTLDHPPSLVTFAASRGGTSPPVAIGGTGKVVLIDPAGTRTDLPFGGPVTALSRNGSLLASANRQGVIRVWDAVARRIVRSLGPDGTAANTFRVAAIQAPSRFGEPEANRGDLWRLVSQAAYAGAKMIVLPETAVTGYMSQDLKRTWQVGDRELSKGLTGVDPRESAETVPGPSTEFFRKQAIEHGVYLTVPLLEVDAKTGRYYNSVVLLDPFGRQVLHYRKRNPWPWAEQGWATAGDRGNPVLDTPFGRLALLVCYDIHAQAAILKDLAVDTLLYSIAWVDLPESEWFRHQLPGIAEKSGFHIVGANWTVDAGTEPSWSGYGHSLVIHRNGTTPAKAADDLATEVVVADLPMPEGKD